MTIEAALSWLKEHNHELVGKIRKGKYTPSPVRRVEIPKPDGGIPKTRHPHGDFILHTSQRCFGMLSPLGVKTAVIRKNIMCKVL